MKFNQIVTSSNFVASVNQTTQGEGPYERIEEVQNDSERGVGEQFDSWTAASAVASGVGQVSGQGYHVSATRISGNKYSPPAFGN